MVLHLFDFVHLFFGEHSEIAGFDHHGSFTSDAKSTGSLISRTHSGPSVLAPITKDLASKACFDSMGPIDRGFIDLFDFLLFLLLFASFIRILAHCSFLLLVNLL